MDPQADSCMRDRAGFPSSSLSGLPSSNCSRARTPVHGWRIRKGQETTREKDLGGVRVNYGAAL